MPKYLQALQEPQWINCDVRNFDWSILGKFGVIMTDPPWHIRQVSRGCCWAQTHGMGLTPIAAEHSQRNSSVDKCSQGPQQCCTVVEAGNRVPASRRLMPVLAHSARAYNAWRMLDTFAHTCRLWRAGLAVWYHV